MLKPVGAVIAPYRKLPFGVYILFIARVINRMGDFVNFFLTLYLTRYLGFNEKQTGMVLSLVGLSMMAGALFGGKMTDAAGRKKVMLFLQSIGVVCIMACGFIPDKPLVALLLLVFTFFNGAVKPINTSLMTDMTSRDQRSAAYSLLYLGINIGVALGPIIAGFLFDHHRRWIFWGDGVTTIITLILIILFIREPKRDEMHLEEEEKAVEGNSIKALLQIPVLAVYTLLSVGAAFLYSQNNFTLALHVETFFAQGSARLFGMVMSFNAVTVLILTPLLNHFFGEKPALQRIAAGQILYGIGFGLLAFPLALKSWLLLSTLIWTTGEILHATSGGVFVANHTPVNHRGRFNSLFLVTKGAGQALGPLVSGFVLAHGGFSVMWGVCFAAGVLLFMAMLALDRADRRMKTIKELS
ncbi:MAG: MFS transporter [Spirochaetales bacterium]|nr:MFS transporter [Spirochaetales bacterium]